MCELWSNFNPFMEKGREWTLLVQCLRPLLQNERPKQASHQAKEAPGELLKPALYL